MDYLLQMEVVLEQKDAADWVYRGEGAANLVLAYIGSCAAFFGKVLRIGKAPRNRMQSLNSPSALSMHECLLWKDIDGLISSPTKEIAGQLFVKHVMSPLLGSEHVDCGMRVLVSKEFLASVEKNVLSQRPAWRVVSGQVNTLCDSALLLSDHSVFHHGTPKEEQCISVEIKPKCGFLPNSEFIAEENAIKKKVARFKMHQFLKLHEGEISQMSEYDPLDLFSQSKDRVHKAINALFTTPQNNFRVFLNGSLIHGSLGGVASNANNSNCTESTSNAFEDIIKCIMKGEDGLCTTNFIQLLAETVYQSKVTDRLLEVQKLDIYDIEGAIHAYYDIISQHCKICTELGEEKSLHDIPLDRSVKILRDYLIAATAKDCSLMISFRQRSEEVGSADNSVYLEATDQTFDYKAYFIDLDMKPLKKMEYYYELDQKIVRHYTRNVKDKQDNTMEDKKS